MMKKQMKRTVYEAPVTERFQVELEGGFMAGSIVTDSGSKVESTGHEIGDTFSGMATPDNQKDIEFTVTWE